MVQAGPSSTFSTSYNLSPTPVYLQRSGDWVSYTLGKFYHPPLSIVSASLSYNGGCSIDTASHQELLSIYNKITDTRTEILLNADTTYVQYNAIDISQEFLDLMFDPNSILSIRTEGTPGSWLMLDNIRLEVITDAPVVSSDYKVPYLPAFRYHGSKEGSKFYEFANFAISEVSSLTLAIEPCPKFGNSNHTELLLSLSTELQHIRRRLEYWRDYENR